jgi:hypothetical protein
LDKNALAYAEKRRANRKAKDEKKEVETNEEKA